MSQGIIRKRLISLKTNTSLVGGFVGGSGTLNFVSKWTPDGVTIGNSQIYDDASNIGINISSSLAAKLHIKGAASTDATLSLKVQSLDGNNTLSFANGGKTSIVGMSAGIGLEIRRVYSGNLLDAVIKLIGENVASLSFSNISAGQRNWAIVKGYNNGDDLEFIRGTSGDANPTSTALYLKGTTGFVGINTTSPLFQTHIFGRLAYGVPDSAATDGDLSASQVTAYLNEAGNLLTFRVKYADGVTLKTGAIALV